ncbi:MAG: PilZ domain-containing protein [Planctomycetes bacterium]|nr:PilZ domain-containing protein [Planctomycetota bacterium]
MDKDKRRHARTPYKGANVVCYSPDDSRGGNPYNFATHVVDVSLGGVCVLSVGRLRTDIRLIVDIFFQQHRGGLKAPVVVRWSREVAHKGRTLYMTGLEFLRRPDFTGLALDAVLGRQPPGPETRILPAKPDRRREARVRVGVSEIVCVPAGLLASLGLAGNVAKSLLDLSSEGARFSTRKPLAPGQAVRLRVRIPRVGEVLTMLARVRWCRPDERARGRHVVGVRFEKVPAKSRGILGALERWFGEGGA